MLIDESCDMLAALLCVIATGSPGEKSLPSNAPAPAVPNTSSDTSPVQLEALKLEALKSLLCSDASKWQNTAGVTGAACTGAAGTGAAGAAGAAASPG